MSVLPEYDRYDGLGLADLVRRKEVTAGEVIEEAIARIEVRNPAVNAVVNKMYDHARKVIAAGLPSGPFTGVPYLLKDLGVQYTGAVTAGVKLLLILQAGNAVCSAATPWAVTFVP